MKVFHVNKRTVENEIRKGRNNRYTCKRFYGHIIVFEPRERTNFCFARLFDPKGRICHSITKEMFHMLAENAEHIYERNLSADLMIGIRLLLNKASGSDLKELQAEITLMMGGKKYHCCEPDCPCGGR